MCGIVGYVGDRQAQKVIMKGLSQLEYRGYDSSGLAVINQDNQVGLHRDVGKLSNLQETVSSRPLKGKIGIGHTRWATHGKPSERNAHPHTSMRGRVILVHNGIVENYSELREELSAEGIIFQSDTDSEVIVQMAESFIQAGSDFVTAMRFSFNRLRGSNAVVALYVDEPDTIVCARQGYAGGIALGLGQDEMFVASDIPAILDFTRQVVFLEDQQVAVVKRDHFDVLTLAGESVEAKVHAIPWDPINAVKGEFRHFMQKEIFEQPRAIIDTMRNRIDFDKNNLSIPELNLTRELVGQIKKLYIVACGTSYYAALIGRYMIESIARLPVEVDYGSEFRYSDPIIDSSTGVLTISQSGETADTLAASDLSRSRGAVLWSIVNVIGSQAMRLSDGYIAMQAGPEIGVATTKAFVTSLVDLYMLACLLGHMRQTVSDGRLKQLVGDMTRLPELAGQVLDRDDEYQELASRFYKAENFLFIGRGINYPIALEGALKLKEISYIHAEGYPAGEMKHGPIALIDESMPVVAIATQDDLYDKMISQLKQARARGGVTIALATAGDQNIQDHADFVIYVPETPPLLAPIINVIPLQLLSYHIAVRRGCDVDQPRNLAKSVTVE